MKYWERLPEKARDYIISSLTTFVATFLLVISVQIGSDEAMQWNWASIAGLVSVALRGAVRALAKEAIPYLRSKVK